MGAGSWLFMGQLHAQGMKLVVDNTFILVMIFAKELGLDITRNRGVTHFFVPSFHQIKKFHHFMSYWLFISEKSIDS